MSRSIYYKLIKRDTWFELGNIQEKLKSIGISNVDRSALIEFKDAVQACPNNLPLQPTSFIGREKEIVHIKSLLRKSRLLTLTGAGGCGKSWLTLEVAAELSDDFPDGMWLVELAPLSAPALVAQNVAGVLGLPEEVGKPIDQTLQEYLEAKHLLLLLDNCEHVLEGCVHLLDALLKYCPHITVLANSRERLGIKGEQTYKVPSLTLPPEHGPITPQSLLEYEAVRLFVDRAQAVKPQFELTQADADPLAKVCVRLDGIPLALELAAARVRSLSVEEIHTRLDNRFLLLTGGCRTSLPRHQTLRALIDWSYDLLHDKEKALLYRLSVFAGEWRLEAAEQVCTGEGIEKGEVLDLLTSLVDKSLVMYEDRERKACYRLLETMRQYGQERLIESGERDAVRGRHRNYFLALAEEAEPKLTGADQVEELKRLEEEHENLRAALQESLSEAGSDAGLRLCGALQRFWLMRGYLSEGREWCRQALEKADAQQQRSSARAKVLNAVGLLALYQGDFAPSIAANKKSLEIYQEMEDAHGIATSLLNLVKTPGTTPPDFEQLLAMWRATGDQHGLAAALAHLGVLASGRGNKADGMKWQLEGLAIRRKLDDLDGIAASLSNLAHFAMDDKDYSAASTHLEESLKIGKRTGNTRGIAQTLLNLGWLAYYQNEDDIARAHFEASLNIVEKIGDKRGITNCLGSLARLAIKTNHWERAAVLMGATEALSEEIQIGGPQTDIEREEHDRDVATVRHALDEAVYSAAWAQGRAMPLDQAIADALETTVE